MDRSKTSGQCLATKGMPARYAGLVCHIALNTDQGSVGTSTTLLHLMLAALYLVPLHPRPVAAGEMLMEEKLFGIQ